MLAYIYEEDGKFKVNFSTINIQKGAAPPLLGFMRKSTACQKINYRDNVLHTNSCVDLKESNLENYTILARKSQLKTSLQLIFKI